MRADDNQAGLDIGAGNHTCIMVQNTCYQHARLLPGIPTTLSGPAQPHLQRVCEIVEDYAHLLEPLSVKHTITIMLAQDAGFQQSGAPAARDARAVGSTSTTSSSKCTEAVQRQPDQSGAHFAALSVATSQLTSTACCLPCTRQQLLLCTSTNSSSSLGTAHQQPYKMFTCTMP
jgi:hypothetical protein